jgi:hypothetical protein
MWDALHEMIILGLRCSLRKEYVAGGRLGVAATVIDLKHYVRIVLQSCPHLLSEMLVLSCS